MPIAIAPIGKTLQVIRIVSDEITKKHLENLGITLNSEIEVISQSGGSIICKVKDSRIAFDQNMSTKIFVKVK